MALVDIAKVVELAIPRVRDVFKNVVGTDVDIKVLRISVQEDVRKVIDSLCADIETAVVVYAVIEEYGIAMLIFDLDQARKTILSVASKQNLDEFLNEELAEDIIKELGNEIIGSVLSALSYTYNRSYRYEVPVIVVEMCRAIISEFVSLHLYKAANVAIISLEFIAHNVSLPIKLLLSM